MSIIHEALKKAARESSSGSVGGSGIDYFGYEGTPRRVPRWVISAGLVFLGGVALYYLLRAGLPHSHSSITIQPSQVVRPTATPTPTVDALAQMTEGLDFFKKGDLPKAEKAFETAVRLAPDLAVAHNNLGLVLRSEGRLKEAAIQYQEALRLNVQYAEANHNLGLVYDLMGRFDEAIAHYQRALELNPSLAESHYQLAVALERDGALDGAKREYRSFLADVKGLSSEKLEMVSQHLQDLQKR
jgi:tetratricopeptide (TPR) repeat protein